MAEALSVAGVVAGYRPDLPILRGVDLSAAQGAVTVIIGPNGAGKSTLVKAIAGVVPVTAGRIAFGSNDITGLRPDRMAQHGIAYVPQSDNIFRSLSVRQNLDLALARGPLDAAAGRDALLQRFPVLAQKVRVRAGALSGGQRQLLAMAMALAAQPRLMLLDEPSAGLSPRAAAEVLDMTRDLAGQGVTVLLVEQNVKAAMRIADHCFILAEGRNQIDGPAADLTADPRVAQIYLGGKRMHA